MKHGSDILSMAAALYDGGWRSTDSDELEEEYNLEPETVKELTEIFEEWEKKAMYLESDNGGRCVFINIFGKWYHVDCTPYGKWGDIDIIEGTEKEAAERIRKAIEKGECYGITECKEEIQAGNALFQYIPEYDGMTATEIEEKEDETTLTEI